MTKIESTPDHDVYVHPGSNTYFSSGVSRISGENKAVTTAKGVFLVCVHPLVCDPLEHGLVLTGTISNGLDPYLNTSREER